MIKNLGHITLLKLLEVSNLSWKTGTVPQVWPTATMIPIYKKGKDKREPVYQFDQLHLQINVLKELLTRGLFTILKQNRSWCPNRQDLGAITADDKVTLLSQEIEDCIQEQKVEHAVWIDLQKAFDKVWKDGLLIKRQRNGITYQM